MRKVIVQVADAGTGKTTSLSVRAAQAVEQYGPNKVIACSLSRTGAKQVGRELELPYDQFATIHGFAHRALGSPELAEAHIDEWNAAFPQWELSGGKKTADDAYDTAGTEKSGDRLKSHITKDQLLTGDTGRFALEWLDWKKTNGYLDFNDVLREALENTDTAPGDPALILDDEAQDTPPLAMRLLFHWAKRAQELVITGDFKQGIFSFLGADALLLQRLWKKYDPARLPLPQSYRLSQAVYGYAREWQRRFTTTLQGDFLPTAVPGFVRQAPSFKQWRASRLRALFDEHEGQTIMFLTTCGYMLDGLIHNLREAGIPYHNPMRITNGKWQSLPQGRKNSFTVVDKVVAFSLPSEDIWGDRARFWTARELKAWTSALPAKGVLSLGGKKGIEALSDDATDEEIALAFFHWFTPEAITHIAPVPDIPWFMAQVKGSDNLRDFVNTVIRAHGVPALKDRPRAIVGSIHCSPGDEEVLTQDGYVPIENIDPTYHKLASYDGKINRLGWGGSTRCRDARDGKGYTFEKVQREYCGDLIIVETPRSTTRITPNHIMKARFASTWYEKIVVYLMRRGNWYRVGMCSSAHRPYYSGSVSGRLATERADAGWVLGVFETKQEALMFEAYVQSRFGIPSLTFEAYNDRALTTTQLHTVHESVSIYVQSRVKELFAHFGLLEEYPLYVRKGDGKRINSYGTFFSVRATNLINGYMEIPTVLDSFVNGRVGDGKPEWYPIKVTRQHYSGTVYSLDVKPYHYYISGGAVVHNSLKGAEADIVVLSPDISREGYESARNDQASAEELRRQIYVGLTRAKSGLYLCAPDSPTCVRW